MTVEPAKAGDLDAIRGLLRSSGLPVEDIGEVSGFVLARSDGVLVGTIGLEHAGKAGLLRSLSVTPEAIQQTAQFRTLCPASATLMARKP